MGKRTRKRAQHTAAAAAVAEFASSATCPDCGSSRFYMYYDVPTLLVVDLAAGRITSVDLMPSMGAPRLPGINCVTCDYETKVGDLASAAGTLGDHATWPGTATIDTRKDVHLR